MSRDTILKDEEGTKYSYDNLATQHHLRGHVPGMERAYMWLKERATKLFNEKKDGDARLIRDIADQMKAELEPQLRKNAAKFGEDHPSVIEEEENEGESEG